MASKRRCYAVGEDRRLPAAGNEGKVFSGEASQKMWDSINKAGTVYEVVDALYLVCCRLQEYENKIDRLMREEARRG